MVGGKRPTLFSDAWSLGAVLLQWMTRLPPWDMQVGMLYNMIAGAWKLNAYI